jgi:hypothetical protein
MSKWRKVEGNRFYLWETQHRYSVLHHDAGLATSCLFLADNVEVELTRVDVTPQSKSDVISYAQ